MKIAAAVELQPGIHEPQQEITVPGMHGPSGTTLASARHLQILIYILTKSLQSANNYIPVDVP